MLKNIIASIAVLGATVSIAAMGTFATFTSSTEADQASLATGSVSIALGEAGPANRLTLGANGLLPGDTMQRVVDLSNSGVAGSDDLGSVALTTAATTSSLLDTDATNGLKVAIDKCSQAWTESGSAPAFTYTCGGTSASVLAERAVIGSNVALSNLSSLAAGQTDHLRVTLTLPAGAPNAMQGLSSQLTYTFTGTQRTATSK
jgi:predicted ribosomally synthesized peptide with SipW-like signal peptide